MGVHDVTISVVIPTYNRADLLPRAIDSVLNQTHRAWQLCIVDDGSTDRTADVMHAYEADARITLVRIENGGAAAARNYGARIATAPYLTFLDSDDVAEPSWLETLAEMFVARHADIVTCLFDIETPDGHRYPGGWSDYDPMFPGVRGNFTHGGTWATRREIFLELGGFVSDLPSAEHTELGFRLLAEAENRGLSLVAVEASLITYFSNRTDGLRQNDVAVLRGAEYMIEHHSDRLGRDPARLSDSHGIAAFRAARLGRRSLARAHATTALRLTPRDSRAWIRAAVVWIWVVRPQRWQKQGDDRPEFFSW